MSQSKEDMLSRYITTVQKICDIHEEGMEEIASHLLATRMRDRLDDVSLHCLLRQVVQSSEAVVRSTRFLLNDKIEDTLALRATTEAIHDHIAQPEEGSADGC